MEKLTGICQHCVFFSEKTFFGVYKFKGKNGKEKSFTVAGSFPQLETGETYEMEGEFTEHPKYGIQFKPLIINKAVPTETEGIVKYLSSSAFHGIGEKTALAIVERLGNDTLKILREDSDVLYQIPELNEKKIEAIKNGLEEINSDKEKIIQYFMAKGFTMKIIMSMITEYGDECRSVYEENPYQIIYDIDGIGFKTIDQISLKDGTDPEDPNRLEALVVSLVMNMCMKNGDTYVTYDDLSAAYLKETYCSNLDDIISAAIFNGHLVEEGHKIYHYTQYQAEVYIGSILSSFPFEKLDDYDHCQLDQLLIEMQKNEGIVYDEKQLEAIHTFFDNDLMILTGGPGTGKTTVVKALTALFHKCYPGYELACIAPTGRAAKRLSELCEVSSYTIHSLLQWNLESNTFGRNEDNPLLCDVLIIDEFSMVDNFLFYNLLKACHNVKKICIIGDPEQLPSVSCGDLLNDLIMCRQFETIRLEHIYRQTSGSDIVTLAYDIAENNADFYRYSNDVVFFECDKYEVKNNACIIVENALNKGYGINDVQVLSAMYKGVAGIDRLNNALQEMFNPHSELNREIKSGALIFREKDKVLQLKNQPDDNVYNGDIGFIEEILYENEIDSKAHIFVRFDNKLVEYMNDSFENITLAYCISVHKSQGSEYPIVIMPLVDEQNYMLQRKLIYTGVTRAKSSLILLGSKACFYKGISIKQRYERKTGLREKLALNLE